MSLLEVRDLHVHYGHTAALCGVSIAVAAGAVVTLLGANGAGKSTLLKAVCGQVRPTAGQVLFDGADMTGCPPHASVPRGITLCPEGRRLFADMTVWENVRMGAYTVRGKAEVKQRLEWVTQLFPRIGERARQRAGSLSGGEQQMVAIARALMTRPRLLMLDEPTLGLAPRLIHSVAEVVRTVAAQGIAVLLVEQNARLALQLAQHGYVLETGAIALHGPAAQLLADDRVQRIYLGA